MLKNLEIGENKAEVIILLDQVVDIILHTLLTIISMFLLTKLLGKRQLSEISLFGYVSGISIGNIAAYIVLEQDDRYLALLSLVVWVLVTYLLEKLTLKSGKLRHVIDGKARLLVEDGVVYKDAFKKEIITVEEFLEQLHDHDVYRIDEVQTATIEPSGDITVLLKSDAMPFTPSTLGIKIESEREPATIIIDGQWQIDRIEQKHLNQEHYEKIMKKHRIPIEDVFIAQAIDNKSIYVCFMDGNSKMINNQEDQPIMTINELKDTIVGLQKFLKQQEKKNSS